MKTTLNSKLAAAAATTAFGVAALMGLAGPAGAAPTGDTTATFTITGGALNITVPTSPVALATVATGAATASGQLGTVTVADTRGALLSSWTTTVTSTAFVTGTSTPNETVPAANVQHASGAATSSGLGVFVPGVLGVGAHWTGAGGNNSSAWNPTLTFPLLASQVAGTYTGSITHSVA
jgi:hypothetical protein